MPGGRPLKFKSAQELNDAIAAYFKDTPKDEWTITGLAIALDTFRSVLVDYGSGKHDEKDPEFSSTVKKAKQIVENGYEIDLKKHGRTGTIFALKNFDWKDKMETDVTSGGQPIQPIVGMRVIDESKPNGAKQPTTSKPSSGLPKQEPKADTSR